MSLKHNTLQNKGRKCHTCVVPLVASENTCTCTILTTVNYYVQVELDYNVEKMYNDKRLVIFLATMLPTHTEERKHIQSWQM